MNDNGCFMVALLFILLIAVAVFGVRDFRRDNAHSEWYKCRTLISSGDSVTVLRARPECAQWTWPQPKEGADAK